jgi:hypothetical protein
MKGGLIVKYIIGPRGVFATRAEGCPRDCWIYCVKCINAPPCPTLCNLFDIDW